MHDLRHAFSVVTRSSFRHNRCYVCSQRVISTTCMLDACSGIGISRRTLFACEDTSTVARNEVFSFVPKRSRACLRASSTTSFVSLVITCGGHSCQPITATARKARSGRFSDRTRAAIEGDSSEKGASVRQRTLRSLLRSWVYCAGRE